MRKLLFVSLVISSHLVFGQYSFRSAGSNSGIIAGTTNAANFAGINYDLSSSKLGLSYKQALQEKIEGYSSTTCYPRLWGYNAYLGFTVNSGKSTLLICE